MAAGTRTLRTRRRATALELANLQHPGRTFADARRREGKTLVELAGASGVAASTISRIENGLISPTYGVLAKLAAGLGMRWSDLLGQAELTATGPLAWPRSALITRANKARTVATARGDYAWHAARLRGKRMEPTIIAPAPGSSRTLEMHDGEEFLLVLRGKILLLMEGAESHRLALGDSAYFDAAVPHAVVAETVDTRVLSILAPSRV